MTHYGDIIGERDNLSVIDCVPCGYAHLTQFPSAEELDAYYQSEFWQKEKPDAKRRFDEQRDWWKQFYGDCLSLLSERLLFDLCDVGCGYGLLMETARERGMTVMGIDPSDEVRRELAKQVLMVISESWETALEADNQFDVISAMWLLEHLPNPREFLQWCGSHLTPNGCLLLAVPNDFSWSQITVNDRVSRRNWWIHYTHINYFDWSSLSNLLGLCGFRIIDKFTQFPIEFYLPNCDYTVSDDIGHQVHAEIEKHDNSMTRKERVTYYRQSANLGIGREIIVVAEKV